MVVELLVRNCHPLMETARRHSHQMEFVPPLRSFYPPAFLGSAQKVMAYEVLAAQVEEKAGAARQYIRCRNQK